jgi:AAA domain-containing protein
MTESIDLEAHYSPLGSLYSESPNFDRAARIAGAVRIDDVETADLHWPWPNRIPLCRVTLLVGDPGLGKSLLGLDIAARISRGTPWPDDKQGGGEGETRKHGDSLAQPSHSESPLPSSVLLLTAEDDLRDTVRPRLKALDADTARVVAIPAIPGEHVDVPSFGLLSAYEGKPIINRAYELRRDLNRLDLLLRAMPDCRLVIIDPISAYLGNVNEHANRDVRGLMLPLAGFARRYNVAVLAVSHLRKKEGAAIYRTMGSLAFVAAARAAWVVTKDQQSPDRRLLLPLKNNLARDTTGLAFTIESHPASDQPIIRWSPEPIAVSAETIVGNARPKGRPDTERQDAIDWLRERLAGGPAPAKEIQEEADAHGIRGITLRRAFRELRGEAVKVGSIALGQCRWKWKLPGANCPVSHQDDLKSGEEFRSSSPKTEDSAQGKTSAGATPS